MIANGDMTDLKATTDVMEGPRDPRRLSEVTVALRSIVLQTPPGALIGRENELMLRLGCHQNLLRQVARRLEAQGLLFIRRGAAGGYFASRPDEDLVIDTAALYLVGEGITLRDALLTTRGMVIDAAGIAADRAQGQPAAVARALLEELRGTIPEDTGAQIFLADEERIDRAIFGIVGIGALQLFINMLNRFSLAEFGEAMFTRQPARRGVYRAERLKTIEAILARDVGAARHSMMRVTDMIDGWLSAEDLDQQVGHQMILPGDSGE